MSSGIYMDDIVIEPEHPQRRGEVRSIPNDLASVRLAAGVKVERHASVTKAQHQQYLNDREPPPGTAVIIFEDNIELVALAKLRAVFRFFSVGDIVALPNLTMTGVVLDIRSTCTLQGLCTYDLMNDKQILCARADRRAKGLIASSHGEIVEGVPASELTRCTDLWVTSIVIYQDWLGVVVDVSSSVALKLTNNTVVEMENDKIAGQDGKKFFQVGDFVSTTKGSLRKGRWIYGRYNANVMPCGTVVQERRTSVDVNWLYPRSGNLLAPVPETTLERLELESDDFIVYRPWNLPATATVSDGPSRITYPHDDVDTASRVKFIDHTSALAKYNKGASRLKHYDRRDHLGYDMNVLDVVEQHNMINVMWQDSTMSQHECTQLRFERSTEDTHSAWPGEIAHTLEVEDVPGMTHVSAPKGVGVIQSINADERIAKIRWCPSAEVHFAAVQVKGGEPVKELVRKSIGMASGEAENVSLYDVEMSGALNCRRGDLVLINDPSKCNLQNVEGINWIGEIVEDRLDGALTIRLGAAKPVQDAVLLREQVTIAIRSGGIPGEDMGDDDSYDSSEDMDSDDLYEIDESMEDVLERGVATYVDEEGQEMEIDEADMEDWESMDEDEQADERLEQSEAADVESMPESDLVTQVKGQPDSEATQAPPSYYLQDSDVPNDHHFRTSSASTHSARMKQIQKDHRIFQKPGAIPDGVYVFSWETRPDLWRVLFIGPQDTPYADAPFVVDFYLPTDYPQSAPQAFFHSWTGESGLGAVGPVNPNLYEDGKICLSLLNTWDGERCEHWNPMGSTLLQVVVSLLGLVLVREPYFNEAGYDVQIGTEEAKRPSILYNERVVLRSFNFAISAVAALQSDQRLAGTQTLEPVLEWLYRTPNGACLLDKLYRRVQSILSNSVARSVAVDGLTSMSQGACISLRRVLTRLDELRSVS